MPGGASKTLEITFSVDFIVEEGTNGSMSYCESDVDFSDKAISIHRHAWG